MRKEFEKNNYKTEILDDDFLTNLEQEIQKKYPNNTTNNEKTEILEDTIEILEQEIKKHIKTYNELEDTIEFLNDRFEELNKASKNLDDTIELLKSDITFLRNIANEDIEILDEEIEGFKEASKNLENTTELLDITKRLEPIKVRKKITPKKRPWIILLTVCTCIIALFSYKTIIWHIDSKQTNQQIEKIVNSTSVKEININKGNIAEATQEKNNELFNYLDVDFTNLLKQNNEVKGWIKVNNTNINYPFVQTDNNEYYLKHSFDKSYNSAGWVFADFRNNFEELDQNTILYAHGRLDNTMFGSLKQVIENDWYENKENKMIQISTLTTNSIWQVFSVYTIKPETYYITPNFNKESEYQKFINTLKTRSVYNFNTDLDITDKIITLSSCYNDELRVVLHAKLVNSENK